MITADSRYALSYVTNISYFGETRQTIMPSPPAQEWVFDFSWYTMTSATRIDELAALVYGDASKWWLVADANPEVLDWHDVAPGTVIRVPRG